MQKPSKRRYSVKSTVALALAAVIFGLSIYTWNAENIIGDKLPMPLGFGVSTVMSGSMEPHLSVYDLIIIRKTKNVEVGDVAVFQSGNSLVVHRIIEMDGDEIVTKGDANNGEDRPISRDEVKGVLVGRIRGMGRVVMFLRRPIVVTALLLAAMFMTTQSFINEKEKDKKELDSIREEIKKLNDDLKK